MVQKIYHNWEKEKEEYIEMSFIEWGWRTNEEHKTYMETLEEKIQNGSTPAEARERLKVYAQALHLERAKFRKKIPTSSSSPRRQWFTLSSTRGQQTDSELYWFGRCIRLLSPIMKSSLQCRKRE